MSKNYLILVFFLTISSDFLCIGQIIDFNFKPIYLPVFDQTDNFYTSYLTVLENTFYQAQEDTLRLALINIEYPLSTTNY